MEQTLIKYQNRLIDLSARNRSLVLKKIYNKRSFDITVLDELYGDRSSKILDFILKRSKGDYKLLNSSSSKMFSDKDKEKSIIISKNFKSLKAEIDMVEKESGSYELFIGYLFAEGQFLDKTFVRSPLLLFPVKIFQSEDEWFLANDLEQNIQINKTFVMSFQQYNEIKLADFDLEFEEMPDKFSYNWLVNYLYENKIKISLENFETEITKFKDYLAKDTQIYKQGDLFLKNHLILGQFPISSSSLSEDYKKLLEQSPKDGLVHNLLSNEDDSKLNEISKYKNSDDDIPIKIEEKNAFFLTDTDYSQEKSVFLSQKNDQLVIYGPPGTGKSQVIVNLIADNLANGKKVLMVSQKRAALDVVYNRLSQFGLHTRTGFVHDYNKDWQTTFEKVLGVLEEEQLYSQGQEKTFNMLSENIDSNLDKLEEIAKLLHKKTDFGLSLYQLYSKSKVDPQKYLEPLFNNFENFEKISYIDLDKTLENLDQIMNFIKFDFKNYLLSQRKDFSNMPEIEKNILLKILDTFLTHYNKYIKNTENEESTSEYLNIFGSSKINISKVKDNFIDSFQRYFLRNLELLKKDIYNKAIETFEKLNEKSQSINKKSIKVIEYINLYLKDFESKNLLLNKENYKDLNLLKDLSNEIKSLKPYQISYWKLFFKLKKMIKKASLSEIFLRIDNTILVDNLIKNVNNEFDSLLNYDENPEIFRKILNDICAEADVIKNQSNQINEMKSFFSNNIEKYPIKNFSDADFKNFKLQNDYLKSCKNTLDLFINFIGLLESTISNSNDDIYYISANENIFSKLNNLVDKYNEFLNLKSNKLNTDVNSIIEDYNFFISSTTSFGQGLFDTDNIIKFLNDIKNNVYNKQIIDKKNVVDIFDEYSNTINKKESELINLINEYKLKDNSFLDILVFSHSDLLNNNIKSDLEYKQTSILDLDKINKYIDEKVILRFQELFLCKTDILDDLKKLRDEIDINFSNIKIYDQMKSDLNPLEKELINYCLKTYGEDEDKLKLSRGSIFNTFYLKWIDNIESKNTRILQNFSKEKGIREIVKNSMEDKKPYNISFIMNTLNKNIDDSKSYNRLGNEATYKDMKHEANKKRKKMTLRKYINEFEPKGLFNLLPCWLVTPEVASAIFPFKQDLFDIIIFDEASQMFVEQGIPSLYRAKKVVIAGDDKQLQPSDLYKVKSEDDEDKDENDEYQNESALEVKSLLDLAKVKYKSSTLTYHYRAIYEELINFSNYAFYNKKIQITPNRTDSSIDKPIERIKVDGQWINRTNKIEAEEVVNQVKNILMNRENDETIGIITFNSTQKDLITEMLEDKSQDDIEFRELYLKELNRKNGDEDTSIFVKNIENVQGDERDIIIFSIGYAKNELGKLSQRFGSLNMPSGENRLNVAISRAKRKIYIVTSIEPEELSVDDSKNSGPKLFKKYLQYARAVSNNNKTEIKSILEGLLNRSDRDTSIISFDSDFENQVYDELIKLGYEIHTQVGASGYKIDLAVYDKKRSEYVLGIECDGAMYHSSKSARERDIYRQRFLESRGWKIHRIWSKNWWQNPQNEIDIINNILKKILIN